VDDPELLAAARGDETAFARLVQPYRRELHAHCYRMLGCVQDAEDAVQNALLGAWQGIAGFEGRSSVRSWLYRIATNACLRLADRASKRLLAREYGPPRTDTRDLGTPVTESVWIEPYPDDLLEGGLDPEARYICPRISVFVEAFVTAWERSDVPALLELLTEDARFTMPPLPAWFSGRENVGRFLRERVAETEWRLFPISANGQLAFASYQGEHGAKVLRIGAITVLTISGGRVLEISGFVDPASYASFGLDEEITGR
jgi:RNA polymerase sigma factor (sigma-70 family)